MMIKSNQAETKLLKAIESVLKNFPEYWKDENLLRNKVIEDVRSYQEPVIKELLSNKLIQETYSMQIGEAIVFKTEDFIDMLRYKSYWDNSYTKYTNEIGLTSEGKYLKYNTDIVLDFPHKDCVLEGGMTKEDTGQEEVYYHNVLAKEEIDALLSPKVLENVKKYDQNGEHKVTTFKDTDNLILKGNNLVALHTLKEKYSGKVKMIYIDPPFNTGNDSFKYNDRYNRSTWLTFMKNRLDIANELLRDDGLIWIHLDQNESHYCKVLADTVFGESNFIAEVTWQSRKSVSNDATISINTNHIFCYAKNRSAIKREDFRLPLDEENYSYYDEEIGEYYRVAPFDAPEIRRNLQYEIINPNTQEVFLPPNGRHWITTQEEYQNLLNQNKIKFGVSGEARPQLKVFLSEDKKRGAGKTPTTLWSDLTTTTNATQNLRKLNLPFSFNNPKPEELIQKVIYLSTNENDIVLDFFMGSATTQAVAHKMNRQYIGIEQMDYIETVSVPRLKKVIEGEQGGISENVEWQGGGSFVYAELYSLNEDYLTKVKNANNENELNKVLLEMKENAYLNFKVDFERLSPDDQDYQSLPLDDKKDVLIQALDMNQLYLSYSEIDDTQHEISDAVKEFNHSFYNQDGDQDE